MQILCTLKDNMKKVKKQCKEWEKRQALVIHGCNPSYSGDKDQEDHSSKVSLGK
jgi:hypothetical protein